MRAKKESEMKFKCNTEIFTKEIEYANNFTTQKSNLSINSNVFLQTENNNLTIKSTDNTMGFVTIIPVTTEEPGTTTVSCSTLLSILKTLPNIELDFTVSDGKLNISSNKDGKNFKFSIRTVESNLFPDLLTINYEDLFTINQKEFFNMFNKTEFAVCTDKNRFFLTGVNLQKKGDKLVMVATDGKRLSYIENVFEHPIKDFDSAIIPTRFIQMLKMIGTGDDVFELGFENKTIFANINKHFIYSNLITGNYPVYEKIIPSEYSGFCKARIDDTLLAINSVSQCVESKSKRIYVEFDNNAMMISADNNKDSEGKQMVPCEYNGPNTQIAFNYNFLQAPLKVMDGEYYKICFAASSSIISVYPEPERNYFNILMPMQAK
jgi:DNA polymerase III, beta subunit